MKDILNKMQTKGSGIKCLWAGNNRIEFSDETSNFDVYGEKNGSQILNGSFVESRILEMFATSEIEVEYIDGPW
jgi:hypothetical protein